METRENDIGFILKRIDDRMTSLSNQRLQGFDVTTSQIRVLEFLEGRQGQATSLRDIEAYLHVAHPTIVGLVKRLEIKHFITVKIGETDKRYRQVDISKEGLELLAATQKTRFDIEDELTSGLTDTECDELRALLNKIFEKVQKA